MVPVSDGVSAARSVCAASCEEPDLEIRGALPLPCEQGFSFLSFLFLFSPANGAYLGFLRRQGEVRKEEGGDLTLAYVTCHPKEGLPMVAEKARPL